MHFKPCINRRRTMEPDLERISTPEATKKRRHHKKGVQESARREQPVFVPFCASDIADEEVGGETVQCLGVHYLVSSQSRCKVLRLCVRPVSWLRIEMHGCLLDFCDDGTGKSRTRDSAVVFQPATFSSHPFQPSSLRVPAEFPPSSRRVPAKFPPVPAKFPPSSRQVPASSRQVPAKFPPVPAKFPPVPAKFPPSSRQVPASSRQFPSQFPPSSRPVPSEFPPSSRQVPDEFPSSSRRVPVQSPPSSQRVPVQFPTSSRPVPSQFPSCSRRVPVQFPPSSLPVPSSGFRFPALFWLFWCCFGAVVAFSTSQALFACVNPKP